MFQALFMQYFNFSAFENLTKEKMEHEVVNKQMEEKLHAASKGKECIETAKVT